MTYSPEVEPKAEEPTYDDFLDRFLGDGACWKDIAGFRGIPKLPLDGHVRYGNNDALSTAILRCCRQLYNEGNKVLWTTNTFAFSTANTLRHFMEAIPKHRIPQIRNLEVHTCLEESSKDTAMIHSFILQLTGVRSLSLFYGGGSGEPYLRDLTKPVQLFSRYRDLLWFRILPVTQLKLEMVFPKRIFGDPRIKTDAIAQEALRKTLFQKIIDPHGITKHLEDYSEWLNCNPYKELVNEEYIRKRDVRKQRMKTKMIAFQKALDKGKTQTE